MSILHMWSNRPDLIGCKVALYLNPVVFLPLCGSFHGVRHNCCTVHTTFYRFVSSCQWFLDSGHCLEMGHGVILLHVSPSSPSVSSMEHTTALLPDIFRLVYTHTAPSPPHTHTQTHTLFSSCPPCFVSPFQISSLTSEYIWAQHWGMCLSRWLLTQRRVSADGYGVLQLCCTSRGSCSFLNECVVMSDNNTPPKRTCSGRALV